MRAIEILKERAPKRKEFQKIIDDPSIKMGFECEMLLNIDVSENTIDPNKLPWDELVEYLNYRGVEEFQRAYIQQFSDLVDEHWTEHLNDWSKTNKRPLNVTRQEWKDEFYSKWLDDNLEKIRSQFSIDDYIKRYFDNNVDVMTVYHIRPMFDWYIHGESIFTTADQGMNKARREASESLQQAVKAPVFVSTLSTAKQGVGEWVMKPDESITGDGEQEHMPNAEVVSPPATLEESLNNMKIVFDWMKKHGHITNESTGLHVTLSIDGVGADNFDFLKMMIFFDENYVAQMFDRLDNEHATLMRNRLAKYLTAVTSGSTSVTIDPADFMQTRDLSKITAFLKNLGERLMGTFGKYSSIRSRKNGSFEFRNMGGAGYDRNFENIRSNIVRMAYALTVSKDDKALVKEYITKVANILGTGKFSDPNPGTGQLKIPAKLESFKKIFILDPELLAQATDSPFTFVRTLGDLVYRQHINLTPTQSKELTRYIRQQKFSDYELKAINVYTDMLQRANLNWTT